MTMLNYTVMSATMPSVEEEIYRYRRGAYSASIRQVDSPLLNARSPYSLVTLHGMVESDAIWQGIFAKLASHFQRSYTLSLPWHGDDGFLWGLEASPDEWLAQLFEVLPPGPKIVWAHSFGANALLALMNRVPCDDIGALVMLSPYYKCDYEQISWDYFKACVEDFEAFVADSISIRPGATHLTLHSRSVICDKIKDKYSSFSWLEFFLLFSRTPGLNLARLKCPVLILGGDKDISVPMSDLRLLTARLPIARLRIVRNCGHFAMVEQTGEVCALVEEFLVAIEETM